ncbi:MAG: hypothetical protein KJ063_24310 [Anaerolineae bacterium]|nr:hypothetical protein [Anaerolineae bacterium]
MMQPVMAELKQQGGYHCRVISLCPFRGFPSPAARFPMADAFVSIPERQIRSSPSSGKQGGKRSDWLRGIAREVSWRTMLQRPLQHTFHTPPALVVLPNDAAFPYDHIVKMLHGRDIPFLLMQEGIRFPLPTDKEQDTYGSSGAAAIAAWGESSAAYFRAQGALPETIHCTGSPRFDHICQTDWRSQAGQLQAEHGFGQTNLLFLSNPIDDQGYCTTAEKLALVQRFLAEITPLFADPGFHLIIKLHARESLAEFQTIAAAASYPHRITVLGQSPLYPLFTVAQAAIVLASTVGLEALLFGLPLAVLEIPGVGFVHDYVSAGAALGLGWQRPLAPQVQALLCGQGVDTAVTAAYLQNNLAARADAVERVARLITTLTR